MRSGRIIIVSNRLPVNISKRGGQFSFEESAGGLVSGIKSYLTAASTAGLDYLWIGWPGVAVEEHARTSLVTRLEKEFKCHPVFLTEKAAEQFYYGFCNETVWPLFHYFPSYATYEEHSWAYYKRVNEQFREVILKVLKPGDTIWIHDYHLMLLPKLLREKAGAYPVGFFLHIPFPDYEMFRLLPRKWQRSIIDGLLGADLIGFHTDDYTQDFVRTVLRVFGYEHNMGVISLPDHIVKVDTFPMGIDFNHYHQAQNDAEVAKEALRIRQTIPKSKLVLSIDRLDYTKGILNRLRGYELFLDEYPKWRKKIALILSIVPSRDNLKKYEEMKTKIDEVVGRINGKFGGVKWTPILYQYKSLPFTQLAAHYLASDIALVTPLRDGMNLVAKEYVAARKDGKGVLILSEMTGAAKELGEALLINPNHVREIAEALKEALEMSEDEQRYRLQLMQVRLRRYDITRWAREFLETLQTQKMQQLKIFASQTSVIELKKEFIKEFFKSARRLIFLDYDGTLVQFASYPYLAKPTRELLEILKRLGDNHKNEIVLISGRDRATIDLWFGALPLNLVAEHGAWVRKKSNGWRSFRSPQEEWKSKVAPILERYADRLPGAFVEEKDFSLVWHYRNAHIELATSMAKELVEELREFTSKGDLQIMHGNKVVEVRTGGINKGTVAKRFIRTNHRSYILAIGDDYTDEDLFKVLPKNAHTIKVGKPPSHAKLILPQVHDVLQFLKELVAH